MEKAWGILLCDPWHNHHMLHFCSPCSQVMCSIMGPILHSLLATKMWQMPTESYTVSECMKHIQAESRDSKGSWVTSVKILSSVQSSHGAKRQQFLELHCLHHSRSSAVKLQTQMFYWLDLPLLWNLFWSNSLSVAMAKNVNKLFARICDVNCATDRIIWFPRPSPSIFAYCKSDQKLEV